MLPLTETGVEFGLGSGAESTHGTVDVLLQGGMETLDMPNAGLCIVQSRLGEKRKS